MSESGFEMGLSDPSRAGVYFTANDDLDTLAAGARDAGLQVRRFDLAGCRDKATLLLRMANGLDFPSGYGSNWDALSDGLRDLSWLPAPGYALLFGGAGQLRDAAPTAFNMLCSILEEASVEWARNGQPFWAFLALPDSDFDNAG